MIILSNEEGRLEIESSIGTGLARFVGKANQLALAKTYFKH